MTPLELDIMKAVWRRYPATVRDVQAAIRPRRPLAYTTVMTMMSRLLTKGFLLRSRRSRTHFYQPAVDFADVREAAVAKVVSQFFEGSRTNLTEFLSTEPFAGLPPEDISSPALDETLL